jgi:capsid protein
VLLCWWANCRRPVFDDYWVRPERYNAPRWQARSWSWVDPAKEMKALEMARQLLLQTHGEQIAEYTGEQFEQVMAQIAKENELKEELGLVVVAEEPLDDVEDDGDEAEPTESQPATAS